MGTAANPPFVPPDEPIRIIALVSVIRFADAFGVGMLIPVLPALALELGFGAAMATAVAGIYPFFLMILSPVLGRLSDRRGRQTIIRIASAAHFLGYLLMALFPSALMLILSRALSGAGAANSVAAGAVLADISDEATRGRYVNIRQISFSAGMLCGPLVGSFVARDDIALVFPFMATVALMALICALLLPETNPHARRGGAPASRVPTARGLEGLPVFLLAGCFLVNVGFTLVNSALPLVLDEVFGPRSGVGMVGVLGRDATHLGVALAGVIIFTSSLVAFVAQLTLGGRVVTRPYRQTLPALVLAWGTAFAATPLLQAAGFAPFWASILVTGLAYGLYFPVLATAISLSASPLRQGEAFGLMESVIYLALTIAPLFSGLLASLDPGAPYFAAAAAMAAAAGIGLLQTSPAQSAEARVP